MATREAREARLLQIGALLRSGLTQAEVAKRVGVSRMTVSRLKDDALAAVDGKRPAVRAEKVVAGPVEAARAAGSKPMVLGNALEQLLAQSEAGEDVAPQMSLAMARVCQNQLMVKMQSGELGPKEVADSLAKLETVRRSAESAIEIRGKVEAEVSELVLSIVDRVAPESVYQAVVSELGKLGGRGSGG